MPYKFNTKIPNKEKYYPVRSSNSKTDIKQWVSWAEKHHPEQKFIIVDDSKAKLKSEYKDYWKFRYKQKLDEKYHVYGTY